MFEYNKVYRNKYGRIEYECTCHVCGATCYYARKIKTDPICTRCSLEKNRKNMLQKAHIIQSAREAIIRNAALDDFAKEMRIVAAKWDAKGTINREDISEVKERLMAGR